MRPWHETDRAKSYPFGKRFAAGLFGIAGFFCSPVWFAAICFPACFFFLALMALGLFVLQDATVLLPLALAYDVGRLAIFRWSGHLLGRIDRVILVDTVWWGPSDIERQDEERARVVFGRTSVTLLPRLVKWLTSAPLIVGVFAYLTTKLIGPDTAATQGWAVQALESLSFVRGAFPGYDKILPVLEARGVGPAHRYFYVMLHDLWLASFLVALACAITISVKDDPRTVVYSDTELLDLGPADDGIWNLVLTGGGLLTVVLLFCSLGLSYALSPAKGPWCEPGWRCRWRFLFDLPAFDAGFIGEGLALALISWTALFPILVAPILLPAVRTCLDKKGWRLDDRRSKKSSS